ncbi:hypothetical protein Tco_0261480 [Tanacetum coccineum]
MALQILNGSHEDSFSQLPYYCYNLKLANEGTVTHIHTDADGRFEMLYVGFGFAPTQRRKFVRTNSLLQTLTWEEHLSKEASKDEERLRNGRVYMDWYDVQASQEPVTTEGMGVEDWQAVQGRLNSYNPCINFLSQAENENYYQSQPQSSIQSNNQQSQPESAINYHFLTSFGEVAILLSIGVE